MISWKLKWFFFIWKSPSSLISSDKVTKLGTTRRLRLTQFKKIRRDKKAVTYRSAGFIIMKIHGPSHITRFFSSIHKISGEFRTKVNIIRTWAPLPILVRRHGPTVFTMKSIVTGTGFYCPFTTCTNHGMSHCRTCNCIQKWCLSATWNQQQE